MATLHYIVDKMGGETFRGGAQANIPAPGHGRNDRSVSIGINKDGRIVVNCWSSKHQVSWREVKDDLRARNLIDDDDRPCDGGGQARYFEPPKTDPERVARALELWDQARPIAGTLSQRYAANRAINTPIAGDIARHHGQMPVSVFNPRFTRSMPAFLVAIRNPQGEITAIEITYLSPGGRRSADVKLSRKTVGSVIDGSAARLDPPGPQLVVAEGFWTTQSARQKLQLPSWSLMSVRNMRRFIPPDEVEHLHIAQDNGVEGERAARFLAGQVRAKGKRVTIHSPLPKFGDFNDWHMAHLGLTK